MILQCFPGILYAYPEVKTISPISPSPLQHTAESPGQVPGFFVTSGYENSQNVQEADTILQCFSDILNAYPEDRTISPISPSPLQHTHSKEPRPSAGVFCINYFGNSQKVHEADTIPQCFLGIITSYPENRNDISHFSLSFTTHTSEGPRP